MKHLLHVPLKRLQQGMVSVIALLFLSTVVVFILMQSLSMSGSKSLESQQYFDSAAALALAESGREIATAGISNAVNLDDTQFLTVCASYTSSAPINLGRGTFQFSPSPTATTNTLCPVRVTGSVNTAHRTLESKINFSSVVGTGGYGTNIGMTLNNPYGVPAAAVFNLAWRRQGSTGASPPGGQSDASACILPSCGMQWNLESSSGLPSVGTLGTSLGVAGGTGVPVNQTLSSARNYAEVGLIMGGFATQPVLKGNYSDNKETANTQNQNVTSGTTTSGEAKGWCNGADTLVFGVSGRGDDNPAAAFTNVVFNSAGSPAQPIAMTWVSHFPNTDGSSPNTFGDVFSEIWYTYNPYARMTNASSSGTTITVNTTSGLAIGTLLKVYTGTGAFPSYTRVASVVDGTHFTVNQAPSVVLANATICGGICALFDNPSSSAAKTTTFSLTRANAAAQQWAGGFVCYSGVDPSKVRRVTSSSLRLQQWHEVLNGE
jgi:hypothetical protein